MSFPGLTVSTAMSKHFNVYLFTKLWWFCLHSCLCIIFTQGMFHDDACGLSPSARKRTQVSIAEGKCSTPVALALSIPNEDWGPQVDNRGITALLQVAFLRSAREWVHLGQLSERVPFYCTQCMIIPQTDNAHVHPPRHTWVAFNSATHISMSPVAPGTVCQGDSGSISTGDIGVSLKTTPNLKSYLHTSTWGSFPLHTHMLWEVWEIRYRSHFFVF